ncbi:hypothetical protein MPSEU_000613200 [Mayamaea pseudoterrestris]|nr:hypothetical protein MPSEU_000613200 [Mayamaea pseudoterrestris]
MRVLLPWKAANQQNDEDGQDESEHSQPSFGADLPGEESPRKRLATRDAQDTETDTFVSPTDSKRPRLDQGPIDFEMTAGPLRSKSPSDSDDEKLPAAAQWPPLENEPHDPFHSPSGLIIRANEFEQSYANPAAARDIGRSTYAAAFLEAHDDEARTAPPSLFEKSLQKRGLEIIEMAGDGNCLFRAVALQVYGDVEMHLDVRAAVCDFMEQDPEHFGPFVDEPLSHYVQRKRKDGVHGNNPEIQAMSELFNRPVEVFTPDNGADQPLNIFQKEYATQDEAIRLSYHDGNHYNAVVDPLKPTAGLGLGMPGLKIGLADQLQVSKAVAESDLAADQLEMKRILKVSAEDEVHRVMKESRMHSTVVDDDDLHRALKESAFDLDYDYVSISLYIHSC